jgi:hypothetical protein
VIGANCLPCAPGFFSTSQRQSSGTTTNTWNEWPLRCTPCRVGIPAIATVERADSADGSGEAYTTVWSSGHSYQELYGATQCKPCPAFTEVLSIPANEARACTCSPGYYSPFALRPYVPQGSGQAASEVGL